MPETPQQPEGAEQTAFPLRFNIADMAANLEPHAGKIGAYTKKGDEIIVHAVADTHEGIFALLKELNIDTEQVCIDRIDDGSDSLPSISLPEDQ